MVCWASQVLGTHAFRRAAKVALSHLACGGAPHSGTGGQQRGAAAAGLDWGLEPVPGFASSGGSVAYRGDGGRGHQGDEVRWSVYHEAAAFAGMALVAATAALVASPGVGRLDAKGTAASSAFVQLKACAALVDPGPQQEEQPFEAGLLPAGVGGALAALWESLGHEAAAWSPGGGGEGGLVQWGRARSRGGGSVMPRSLRVLDGTGGVLWAAGQVTISLSPHSPTVDPRSPFLLFNTFLATFCWFLSDLATQPSIGY